MVCVCVCVCVGVCVCVWVGGWVVWVCGWVRGDAGVGLTRAIIKTKGAWSGDAKPALIQSCLSWYRPRKILKSSSRIYFNWHNRVNFKLILLTLLFKSLFFKTNLNCSYFLLPDIFCKFCKYVLSKKIKTGIFNKSGFHGRKLIVIV